MGGTGPGRRIILAEDPTVSRAHRIDVADRSRLLDIGVHKGSVTQPRRKSFPKQPFDEARPFGNIGIEFFVVAVVWVWIRPVLDGLGKRAEIKFEKRK